MFTAGDKNIAQLGALVVGVAYLAIGLIGFAVTGFGSLTANGTDDLLSFDLNPFHNIVHLVIGLYLLAAGLWSDPAVAEGSLIGGGLVYVLAAILGFTNSLQILSINSELASDNFLHLISGSAAILLGFAGVMQGRDSDRDEAPAYTR